jgi:hypothetical protein
MWFGGIAPCRFVGLGNLAAKIINGPLDNCLRQIECSRKVLDQTPSVIEIS